MPAITLPTHPGSTPQVWVLLALVTLLGATLRIYSIGSQSIWNDEAGVYGEAARPNIKAVIGPLGRFAGPPIHRVLLHYWLKLGASDTNARLLSALFGIATIPVFFRLFATLFNASVGILAAALLAINPFHVWYSQEVRMYSIFLFLAALATLLLWKAVEDPAWRRWGVYGLLMVLCGLTHTATLFLAAAHGLFVLLQRSRRRLLLGRFVATYAGVGLMLLPIVLPWAQMLHAGRGWQADKPVSVFNLAYVFFTQSVGFSFGPSIYELQLNTHISAVAPYWREVAIAAVVFLTPLAAGLVHGWRSGSGDGHRKFVFLGLALVVPPLMLFAVDATSGTTMNPRHAITCLIPYIGFLALGLRALGRRLGSAAMLGIVLLSSTALANHYWNPRYAKEDARSAAAYLAGLDGDRAVGLVLTYPRAIRHYYHGPMRILGPGDLKRENGNDLEDKLRGLASGRTEFMLIELRAWHSDPEARVEAACERMFKHLAARRFHGVTVIRYRIPQDNPPDPPAAEDSRPRDRQDAFGL